MDQVTIPSEQVEDLLDELADALQAMVESSCGEMAPLWLAGTRLARRDLPGAIGDMGFRPSERYLRLGRGTQNRYRQLACWRHALLWRHLLDQVDPDYVPAVQALYFTPFPAGEPPYAWSQRVSSAPDAGEFPSPSTLKDWAKEGCWQSVDRLRHHIRDLPERSLLDEVVRALLKTGCRDTLRDVLKLDEHHPAWESL